MANTTESMPYAATCPCVVVFEEATYARGLVVLNKIDMDRIAHLWRGIKFMGDNNR